LFYLLDYVFIQDDLNRAMLRLKKKLARSTSSSKKDDTSLTQKTSIKVKTSNKQSGGNTNPKVTGKKRYFKAIYEQNGKVVCNGRYSGKKPKQAACKALTAITNSMTDKGKTCEDVSINFCVIEQTRGSKNKKYYYEGSKFLLDEPVTVKIKKTDKEGIVNVEEIEYKRGSKVMKCKEEKCETLVAFNPRKEDLEDLEESEQDGGSKKGKKNVKKTNKKVLKKVVKVLKKVVKVDNKKVVKVDDKKVVKADNKKVVKVAKKSSDNVKKSVKKN
jgi:hypothetical protein